MKSLKGRKLYWSLALLSGLLMFAGWPPRIFVFMLFIGFVPLFYLENVLHNENKSRWFGWYTYLALFVWNILTTWWVGYASVGGAIAMLFANSAVMLIPFLAYRYTRKAFGITKALTAFIFYWLGFEYFHLNWDISYPWLTLGNGLAMISPMVQWYEYTGILGGSAWILLLNVLFFKLIFDFGSPKMIQILAVLLVPIGFSALRYYQVKPGKNTDHKILVVQPNIDPYEKFNSGGELAQVDSFISLAEKNLQANTELVVLPETAIVEYLDEDEINNEESIRLLMRFIHKHPGLKILTGASTYRFFKEGEKPSETARKAQDGNLYDSYNTALLIGKDGVETIYHKAKFVPGVEKMPYPKLLGFLEYFSIDMGGISGSLGHDDKVIYFETGTGLKIAPAICYESIYGEFLGSFMQKGANTIFIVTNDGWWEDTDGYRQHMFYGTLRAIEHRCQIVRCANTGTSCFIDERGRISNKTKWWKAETFTTHVTPATKTTFYSRYGDLTGKLSSYIAIVFLLGSFVRRRTKRATN